MHCTTFVQLNKFKSTSENNDFFYWKLVGRWDFFAIELVWYKIISLVYIKLIISLQLVFFVFGDCGHIACRLFISCSLQWMLTLNSLSLFCISSIIWIITLLNKTYKYIYIVYSNVWQQFSGMHISITAFAGNSDDTCWPATQQWAEQREESNKNKRIENYQVLNGKRASARNINVFQLSFEFLAVRLCFYSKPKPVSLPSHIRNWNVRRADNVRRAEKLKLFT